MPAKIPASRRDFRFLALLLPLAASAATPPDAGPGALRAHVEFLADDLLEGRGTASRGHAIGARYVAAQMRQVGLRPAGAGGTWYQPVPLIESRRLVEAAQATITAGSRRLELRPRTDFVPLPSFHGASATVEAPLVFVGYGISAPESGYDDLAGVDLEGKVAVVLDGVPTVIPPALHVYYEKEKKHLLASRGIAGIVELAPVPDPRGTAWEQVIARTRAASMRLLDHAGVPVDSPAGQEAGIILNEAAARRLFELGPVDFERVVEDAKLGRSRPFEFGASVAISTRSQLRKLASDNVAGLLEGSDPKLRHETVVLVAHLDHIGQWTTGDGDLVFNGALDNAGGVAVMLEAARLLAGSAAAPRRSIIFLASTAEEWGLLGSRHFALEPTVPRDSIIAAVNLDMPVALYPASGYTAIGAEHSSLGDIAREALAAEGLEMTPNQAPGRGLFAFTDQYSFVREGIPGLYLHDGPVTADPAVDARRIFDEYLERHYHRVSDDIRLPIDWGELARFARLHARICRAIADGPRRPQWSAGDFYGARFGRETAAPRANGN